MNAGNVINIHQHSTLLSLAHFISSDISVMIIILVLMLVFLQKYLMTNNIPSIPILFNITNSFFFFLGMVGTFQL